MEKHFTVVLNRILFSEVRPLVVEMVSHRNIFLQTEILLTINARNKAAGLDSLPAGLFIAARAITADLLLPLESNSWESQTFPREWKEEMVVKIPKGILFEYDSWKGIRIHPAVAKIITKIILTNIKEHLKNLIARNQAIFRFPSSPIEHINTLRILEQWPEFKFSFHLLLIDFEKAFDSGYRKCI